MFGFSGYLRWLMICTTLFNFIKASPSFASSDEEDHFVFQNIDSPSSQTVEELPEDNSALPLNGPTVKRTENQDNNNIGTSAFKDVGWWPWSHGMTPVRRSFFIPRLGKRTDEFLTPNAQNVEEDFELTPAEEQILEALTADDEEEDFDDIPIEGDPLGSRFLPERETRTSYSFVPRLGKRAYSFSPRLGKRAYSFSPRLGKRAYSFSPRLGKKAYSFSPRLGKKAYSFSPRLGKRAYSFSPRLGKRAYSFSPRLGKRVYNSFSPRLG